MKEDKEILEAIKQIVNKHGKFTLVKLNLPNCYEACAMGKFKPLHRWAVSDNMWQAVLDLKKNIDEKKYDGDEFI